MNCEEVQKLLASRWDLPEGSEESRLVAEHAAGCAECAEAWQLWRESSALVSGMRADEEEAPDADRRIAERVLSRIYAEQRWAMPAIRKTYAFTAALRKRLAILSALLLTLFVMSFWHLVSERRGGSGGSMVGALEAAHAFAAGRETETLLVEVPVASLNHMITYYAAPSPTEHWLGLSLFGVIAMLLVLNWLSRVRA
ncbi:MAG TPA: hypothetical protein VIL22_12040 [Paenibacillaceae bacterium]